MIAIIDYGVGNLFSLSSSLAYLGLENKIPATPRSWKPPTASSCPAWAPSAMQ